MSEFDTPRRRTFGELPVDAIGSVQTAATGTNYTPLDSVPSTRMVRFMHPSVDIEVRVGASGDTCIAPAGLETMLFVADNANELQVRRRDTSGTQVTVKLLLGKY